ncbi:hypothetical protein Pmani_024940 [Petrolisthes manimaculis]|uniref:Uncharacterized protein n=1 Tax=Petrolisthes manimaculis TaxID=1843537 RepID=A0AAE1P9B4_9EUCA|nr:hypothetical protein Pmani_024940 [Petrolisthes manimaculis]
MRYQKAANFQRWSKRGRSRKKRRKSKRRRKSKKRRKRPTKGAVLTSLPPPLSLYQYPSTKERRLLKDLLLKGPQATVGRIQFFRQALRTAAMPFPALKCSLLLLLPVTSRLTPRRSMPRQ